MRPNCYLNKKRFSGKVGDKIGDMAKIACQQKRSFDKVGNNIGEIFVYPLICSWILSYPL